MVWIWAIMAASLVLLIIVSSRIHIRFLFMREKDNDRLLLDFKLLYGLLSYRYDIPTIRINWHEGIVLKREGINRNRAKETMDAEKTITKDKVIDYFRTYQQLASRTSGFSQWFKQTLLHIHCTELHWNTNIGIGDAAETAVTTGLIWAIKTSLLGFVMRHIDLQTQPRLVVNPQYNHPQFSTRVHCIVNIRFGYAMMAGLLLIVRILKVKGGVRTWQNILFKA